MKYLIAILAFVIGVSLYVNSVAAQDWKKTSSCAQLNCGKTISRTSLQHSKR